MTAHVFYYKFPRLKLDLMHEETPGPWYTGARFVKAPIGAYIYDSDGRWWRRRSNSNVNDPGATVQLEEPQVPKEIRLHMLLLM